MSKLNDLKYDLRRTLPTLSICTEMTRQRASFYVTSNFVYPGLAFLVKVSKRMCLSDRVMGS